MLLEDGPQKMTPKETGGLVTSNRTASSQSDNSQTVLAEHPFPRLIAGTQWKDFIFQFIDDENLIVKVANRNNIEQAVNYEDLDCGDKRKTIKRPLYDDQWKLLLKLAASYGEITPGSLYFNDKNEKAKEALTKRLQGYFHIPDDPFYTVDTSNSNKKKGSYKLRADIFPVSEEIPREEIHDDEFGKDIRQSLLDQTPMIDDTE
jgi:hypothetical protein